MKKFFSLLLSICLLVQLTAPAFAAETAGVQPAQATEQADETTLSDVQPEASLAAEADADAPSGIDRLLTDGKLEGSLKRQPLYAAKDNGYYTDVVDAIAQLRSKMVSRTRAISIPLRVSKTEVSGEEEMEALILGIFALATAHTGVANEGDYLLWSIEDLKYGGTYSETDTYYYLDVTFQMEYYSSSAIFDQLFHKDVQAIVSGFGFTEETDDYTKILSIYSFVCDTVEYDYEHLEDESHTAKFTAIAALNDGKAVCQGYALLLYAMLLTAGIDCRIIAGYDAESGIGHAWNIVQLDGVYYNLDSTWDAGYADYAYFLKSPASFTDHIREEAFDSADFHTLYPMAQTDYTLTFPIISSGSCGENAQYTLYATGELEISGTGAITDWASAGSTPWRAFSSYVRFVMIDEGITRVGSNSFSGIPYLLAVVLPEGMASIGSSAFSETARLEAVLIPSTVNSIEANAFYECRKLVYVFITDLAAWCNINFDGSGANPLFYSADLYLNEEKITDLVIPEGIAQIKPFAFYGGNFTSVTIHPGIKTIGTNAFYGCAQLTGVHITDLAAWCGIDFVSADYLPPRANPLSLGADLYLNGMLVTGLVIPDNVTIIKPYAFYGSTITSVTIPANVTEVGLQAFAQSSIVSLTLLPREIQFGTNAFDSCVQLEGVYITDLTAWCNIGFANRGANPLNNNNAALYLSGQHVTDLVIDTNVTSIAQYAFAGANIPSVTVVNPSVKIEPYAFAYARLTSLTLPEGLTELGQYSFAYSSLESLTLPSSMAVIAPYAFYESALKSLVLPEGVTEVGQEAFSRCQSLAEVTIPSTLKKTDTGAFSRYSSNGQIKRNVYISDLEAWCKADFVNGSSPIGNEAYLYLNGQLVTDLVIPEGIEVLKSGPFTYCLNEMTVTLPQSLTRIETNAFAWLNCKTLYIPENVTYIGVRAFYGAKLEHVNFGGVEHIDKSAFDNCSNLKSVDFGDSLRELGGYAFNCANSLVSVTFPASLEKLGDRVVFGCPSLKTIIFEGNAPTFTNMTFDDRSVTAYYPAGNPTWTADKLQNYGGKVTWIARCEHTFVDGVCTVCGAPETLPGDFTNDDLVTDKDAIYLLWHTLFPADYPLNNDADFNDDGLVTDKDAIYLLWHTLFPADYPL